jgi:hypothetical protein
MNIFMIQGVLRNVIFLVQDTITEIQNQNIQYFNRSFQKWKVKALAQKIYIYIIQNSYIVFTKICILINSQWVYSSCYVLYRVTRLTKYYTRQLISEDRQGD